MPYKVRNYFRNRPSLRRMATNTLGLTYPLFSPLLQIVYADPFILAATGRIEKLLVIAPPKVGSTWLSLMLEEYLGWPKSSRPSTGEWSEMAYLSESWDRREQVIEVRKLAVTGTRQVLYWHQHFCYSEYAESVILDANIRCVVMTRDIKDTLVSYIDNCDRHGFKNSLFYMDEPSWNGLSYDEKVDRIVTLVLPWYFKFYAGWFSNSSRFGDQMMFVRYEDLVLDPQRELRRIVNGFGLTPVGSAITDVVGDKPEEATNRNVGVVGRGRRLPQETVDKIDHIASFYPAVDFSGIGIRTEGTGLVDDDRDISAIG